MKHKKYIPLALAFVILLSAFSTNKISFDAVKAKNKAPHALTGKWLNGSFSMSNWWSYDGKKYIGNPYTRSVAFNFTASGEAEFFLVIKTHTGYCSTEAFTYQKGKVKFNDEERSFTVVPEKGNYRGFYSCASGSNFDRAARPGELKSTTYYWDKEKDGNGKEWLVIRFSSDRSTAGSYFQETNW